MFSEACDELVHQFGKNTLRPVPSIDDANNVNILHVVVIEETTKHLFWPDRCFTPTAFKLNEILEDQAPTNLINVPKTHRVLSPNYQSLNTFSLNAKAGVLFKDIVDAEIGATNVVNLVFKFGKVVKTEVNPSKLMMQLINRKLDLNHPFIKQVRQNPNKFIGVVTGVVHIEGEGQISMDTSSNANAEASAKLLYTLSTNVNFVRNGEIALQNKTPLAYNVNALTVNSKDRTMSLCIDIRSCKGFTE